MDDPRSAGGDRAGEAPSAGLSVLPAAAGPAPAATAGRSSSLPGALAPPAGSVQRSALPPEAVERPVRPPPSPVADARLLRDRYRGPGGSPAGGGWDPVAMRLALPAPEPPGTGPAAGPAADPGPGSPAGAPALQRAGEDTLPAAETAAPPTGAVTTSAAAAPAPAADEEMSQEQVDELAKRLVGPIVRRIKADMLLDRERRGLRIDAN